MRTTLKQAVINKVKKSGCDMITWCEYSEHGWNLIDVYGKLRRIHQISYHFEGYSMYIDDVVFSTVD